MTLRSLSLACLLVAASAGASRAQEPAAAPAAAAPAQAGWHYIVEPYLLAPSMSGTTGVAGIEAQVDMNASDIFSVFEAGGMLYLEAHDPTWAFALDGTFMHLGDGGTTRFGTVDVKLEQGAVSATGFRRVNPWAEALLGVQFNRITTSYEATGPLSPSGSRREEWADPYVGVRLDAPRGDKWRFSFTGWIGGFGVGSDFAWQAFPQVGYRFNGLFELHGGYRAVAMDYSNGSGVEQFDYDLTTSGPQLGARFHF